MPRTRFTNVRYALAVPMVLLGAAATGVGATLETSSTPWSVGGGLLALAIAVPILVEGRHHERGLAGMRRGEALARWVVGGDRWWSYVRDRADAALVRMRGLSVLLLGLALVAALITLAVDPVVAAWVALGGLALGLAPLLVPALGERRALRGLRGALIVLGPMSVWIDGKHEVFAGPEQRLNAVIVREDSGRITVHGTCNALPYEVTIPFPPGAEKEAQEVARRIRRG